MSAGTENSTARNSGRESKALVTLSPSAVTTSLSAKSELNLNTLHEPRPSTHNTAAASGMKYLFIFTISLEFHSNPTRGTSPCP